jgi:hypothetical protein
MQRDVRNEEKKTENSLLAPDDRRQVFSETLQPVTTDGAEFGRICVMLRNLLTRDLKGRLLQG